MNTAAVVTPALNELVTLFRAKGYDLRLVGGCVRDLLMGIDPKDVDLCTDATPEQMIEIAVENDIRFFAPGIDHGTVVFPIAGETFEVTTLRIESEHDGRWATMVFTTDWEADLARRDLTVNAISMTIEGEIFDPFGGRKDIEDRKVRFVGDAGARMKEDYLRILRWLRFHGRISPKAQLDIRAAAAAEKHAIGLKGISKERIWLEMAKIVSQSGPAIICTHIMQKHIGPAIGLPAGNVELLTDVHRLTKNPVTLLAAYLGEAVVDLAEDWKWSNQERSLAKFLIETHAGPIDDYKRLLAVKKQPREWVVELALLNGDVDEAQAISAWSIPERPISGKDLLGIGHKPGKAMGDLLNTLTDAWVRSDYRATRDDLLAKARM